MFHCHTKKLLSINLNIKKINILYVESGKSNECTIEASEILFMQYLLQHHKNGKKELCFLIAILYCFILLFCTLIFCTNYFPAETLRMGKH